MRILVDMDDVIADWAARYDAGMEAIAERSVGVRRSRDHKGFNLFADHSEEQAAIIREVIFTPGYYLDLQPIDGALKALYEMDFSGNDVRIVTAPMGGHATCASEKLEWVSRYLGPEWRKRVVITDDKTIVRGDVLFDDKGEITGSMTPEWQQILVDQPHNQTLKKDLPRVASLKHWREAIEMVFG